MQDPSKPKAVEEDQLKARVRDAWRKMGFDNHQTADMMSRHKGESDGRPDWKGMLAECTRRYKEMQAQQAEREPGEDDE